jgi:hypothetical protein
MEYSITASHSFIEASRLQKVSRKQLQAVTGTW